MKAAELRNKSKEELNVLVAEKRSSLRAFRFNTTSKGKNVMTGKEMRRDIARIMTLLKETK